MKKCVKLSEELRKSMIQALSGRNVRRSTLDAMAHSGANLTTKEGKSFVAGVAAATARYDALYTKAVDEAVAAGFDPGVHTEFKVDAILGVVTWMEPEDSDA